MEIRIFTLNCWGLAVVSKNRIPRIKAIAELLASSQYDVVCLQEVWLNSDFERIRDRVSENLPFSHYFHSGVTGSGVCIFSQYRFDEVFFHQWPVNGYIHKIHHGDWFGGKGVGLARLHIKNYIINVYSAHLHAEYDRQSDDYLSHRVLQAYDTAQFIQLTSRDADLVVLAGDLNTEPGDLSYKIILSVPGLLDAFTETAAKWADGEMGTNECVKNSFTPVNLRKNNIPGKRIDYIMYHSGKNVHIKVKKYEMPLPNLVPECNFSYSDHEAVCATLVLHKNEGITQIGDVDVKREILEESIQICEEALKGLGKQRMVYFFFSGVLFALLLATIVTQPPFGHNVIYNILKVIISLLLFYVFLMATLWNNIEKHAIIAGKLSMEIILQTQK